MKKILVFAVTVIMILSLTTGVMAATVYLDTGVNGKAATGSSQWDSTNVFQLGFKAPVDQWFVGLDYSTLTVKDSSDSQGWNYDIKGGYSFVNNNSSRVSATLGYYHQDIRNDILVSAVTLGLDSQFKIAKNFYLEAEIDCALAGKDYQYYGVTGTLDSASDYKVKLNYFLNRNFGVSLGYYYNEYKPEGDPMTSHNSLTLGITGKF
jgi:hypothetical protein